MAESQPSTSQQEEIPVTQTIVIDKPEETDNEQNPPVLHLRLQPPKSRNKVKWSTDTVDNEFMGKKKSKCCCIYQKPKVFGETETSSSDSEDDCTAHCHGHKKKCFRHKPHSNHHDDDHHSHHCHDGQCEIHKG